MPNPSEFAVLARVFLAGEQTVQQIVERAGHTLGRRWRWLRPVVRRYIETFAGQTRPRQRDVVRFLRNDPDFGRAWTVENWLIGPQRMQPVAAAKTWDIPVIETSGALAEWLQITAGELDWFADLRGLASREKGNPKLGHYHYRILGKPSGSIRLIEAPKPRLKSLQRQILSQILDAIPMHPALHGFVKGRSIETFVGPHVGQEVVLKMDLQDFFPSISGARVQSLFRTMGYPESVAGLLGGICSNAAPLAVIPGEMRDLYARPHLPQGAPPSPALANLCAYRFDCRLTGLAKSTGATYTRYADDLAFSGGDDFNRRAERFSWHAAAIVMEEGFHVHHRKTRIMRQGVRQHLAGLVANQRPNIMRPDFDQLKAILTNCAKHQPESQDRDAHPAFRSHLQGRVAFVEMINPAKGRRLRTLFDRIRWEAIL